MHHGVQEPGPAGGGHEVVAEPQQAAGRHQVAQPDRTGGRVGHVLHLTLPAPQHLDHRPDHLGRGLNVDLLERLQQDPVFLP